MRSTTAYRAPRAEREGEDHLARVERLAGAGDAAGLVELDDAVGQHLGVHAEVADAAFQQQRADRIRHAADADLQAGAILDLGCDPARDGAVDLGRRRVRQLRGRLVVALDDVIDLADVNAVLLAEDVRQAAGHLDDHHLRALDDRAVPEIGGAEIEVAALVHRTGLENDDVHRINEAAVIVRQLAEVERQVVAPAGVVLLPVVAREMQAEPEEVFAGGIGLQHRTRLQRQAGADLYVLELVLAGGERRVEHVRLAQRHAVVEPHAGPDEARCLLGRNRPRRSARNSYGGHALDRTPRRQIVQVADYPAHLFQWCCSALRALGRTAV